MMKSDYAFLSSNATREMYMSKKLQFSRENGSFVDGH